MMTPTIRKKEKKSTLLINVLSLTLSLTSNKDLHQYENKVGFGFMYINIYIHLYKYSYFPVVYKQLFKMDNKSYVIQIFSCIII